MEPSKDNNRMRCHDFLAQYSAWRDGLEPAQVFEMEAHLEACPACQAHHAALQEGVVALFESEIELSPDFGERLEQRLRAVSAERQPPHVSPLAATAMAILGALVIAVAARRPSVTPVAAEAQPPVLAHPVAYAGAPFVVFVPRH
jgi:anti-sigma factor RsiW